MTQRIALAALAAALGLSFAADANAAACRDAKGKFIACPAAPAKAATQRCRDAKGHFTACAATGAAANTAAAAPAPALPPTASPRASMARASRAPTGAAANTAAIAPGAATARCRDGSLSYSKHRSGTCAGHGGVAQWMGG